MPESLFNATELPARATSGTDLLGNATTGGGAILAAQFMVPPFSVFNTREGWWQDRKRQWVALGIEAEVGRGGAPGGSPRPACDYSNRERGDGHGRSFAAVGRGGDLTFRGTGFCKEIFEQRGGGTSLFDPVLCELAYRWFCPPGGQVVDPFAGGSVRGIVATSLGFQYWGCDLRQEQVDANYAQAQAICPDNPPAWATGDANNLLADAPAADFLFSCPPYGNLEQYSDDPADLSNMDEAAFLTAYAKIIALACARLKPDRFACFVVANYRRANGCYVDLVGETVRAFTNAGLGYYNEAVLINAIGSLPIRIGRQWAAGRKLGKTHQNVLVFLKGDPKAATQALTQETP